MPIAHVMLIEGASDDQKRELISGITDSFEKSVGAPRKLVRVIIHEVPPGDWGVGGQSFQDRQSGASRS